MCSDIPPKRRKKLTILRGVVTKRLPFQFLLHCFQLFNGIKSIGLTLLISLVEGRYNRLRVLRSLRKCQVRKKGKIGLNQPLIYTCHFRPLSPHFCICHPLPLSSQKKLLLKRKDVGDSQNIICYMLVYKIATTTCFGPF